MEPQTTVKEKPRLDAPPEGDRENEILASRAPQA